MDAVTADRALDGLDNVAGLTCVPHIACSSGTSIGLAVGLYLILATVNTPLIEVDPYRGPGWKGLLVEPLNPVEGHARLGGRR